MCDSFCFLDIPQCVLDMIACRLHSTKKNSSRHENCLYLSQKLLAYHSLLEDDETNSEATERDQNKFGRDQNKVKNSKKLFPPWEQNNDYETKEKVFVPREHNNEIACNETTDGGEHRTKNKQQMTYREALLGLDNSEMSSDF